MLFKISDFSLSARNQPIYYAPKQVFESVYTIWDVYLCILAETVKLRRSQIRISNSIISLIEVNVLLIMKFSGQGYKNSIAEELTPCPFTCPKNVLCLSKFYESAQTFDCIQCLFKNFCARIKTILLNANHLFVWHKMFVTSTISK